jgi:hypothetical protein
VDKPTAVCKAEVTDQTSIGYVATPLTRSAICTAVDFGETRFDDLLEEADVQANSGEQCRRIPGGF